MLLLHRTESISKSAAQDLTFVIKHPLTINGFTGAVMGATFGPAVIGEILRRTMAKNAALLSANIVDFNPDLTHIPIARIYGIVQTQALVVSMKEIYGWLLIIVALTSLLVILVSYSSVRPFAIFPKWSNVRRVIKHIVHTDKDIRNNEICTQP